MQAIYKGLEKEKSKSFTAVKDLGHRSQRFERKQKCTRSVLICISTVVPAGLLRENNQNYWIKKTSEEEKLQFYGAAQIHRLGRNAGAEQRHSSALFSRVCARAAQLSGTCCSHPSEKNQKFRQTGKSRKRGLGAMQCQQLQMDAKADILKHHNVLLRGATAKHR